MIIVWRSYKATEILVISGPCLCLPRKKTLGCGRTIILRSVPYLSVHADSQCSSEKLHMASYHHESLGQVDYAQQVLLRIRFVIGRFLAHVDCNLYYPSLHLFRSLDY